MLNHCQLPTKNCQLISVVSTPVEAWPGYPLIRLLALGANSAHHKLAANHCQLPTKNRQLTMAGIRCYP
jgi:hypothetical protein